MTAIDFIKEIKNTNKTAKFYFIEKQIFIDDDSGNRTSKWLPEVYFTEEEARAVITNLQSTLKAEFGEYLSINLMSGTVEPDDLGDLEWEFIDDIQFDNTDLFEIIKKNDSVDDIDYFYITHEYKSLEGCILVFWSWQTYVGYCRKCEEIRYAYSNETSKICIKEDRCYRIQCSILCEVEEIKNLSHEEINDLVNQKLSDSHWKWQNNAYRIAEEACL